MIASVCWFSLSLSLVCVRNKKRITILAFSAHYATSDSPTTVVVVAVEQLTAAVACIAAVNCLCIVSTNEWECKNTKGNERKKNTPRIVYILCALRCHRHSPEMHRAFPLYIRGGRPIASVRARPCLCVCLSAAHSRRTPTTASNATCALSKRQKGASSFVSIIYELQTRHCAEHCEKKLINLNSSGKRYAGTK